MNTISKRIAGAALIGGLALTFAACSNDAPEDEQDVASEQPAPTAEVDDSTDSDAGLACSDLPGNPNAGLSFGPGLPNIDTAWSFDEGDAQAVLDSEGKVNESALNKETLIIGWSTAGLSGATLTADALESVTIYEQDNGSCVEIAAPEPTEFAKSGPSGLTWLIELPSELPDVSGKTAPIIVLEAADSDEALSGYLTGQGENSQSVELREDRAHALVNAS